MGHSVLPKSTNDARLKEKFDLFDWSIPADLLANFSDIKQASYFRQSSVYSFGKSLIKEIKFSQAKKNYCFLKLSYFKFQILQKIFLFVSCSILLAIQV